MEKSILDYVRGRLENANHISYDRIFVTHSGAPADIVQKVITLVKELTVSPVQAVIFLVYLVILQQLEGNLIYPKVVGSSMGLPAIWVLAAVTIGGGVVGIPGMLLGVPLAATLYRLLRDDVKSTAAKT